MLTIADVVRFLTDFAPLELAGDWDNVGLLLGDGAEEVRSIMTCLSVTPETVREAVGAETQLIVTHHPILFRATKRLTSETIEGKLVLALARSGVAVYSPHTAFDNTRGGINEALARRLELADVGVLRSLAGPARCKLVVFVPENDLARVSDALFEAGAGHIGLYSQCSFRAAGTGTFFGSEATNPTVGQKGRREEVSEWRLEVVFPSSRVEQVIAGMRRAHSYEEPAFDVYPLQPAVAPLGEGRIGRLPSPLRLRNLARRVGTVLNANGVQSVGALDKLVERVAVVCGSGGEFLGDALRAGADVFLTGEMRFHDCLAASAQGLAVILPGHFASERFGVEDLAQRLQAQWPELRVWASQHERDPLQWQPC